jgi:hypothetical protein
MSVPLLYFSCKIDHISISSQTLQVNLSFRSCVTNMEANHGVGGSIPLEILTLTALTYLEVSPFHFTDIA